MLSLTSQSVWPTAWTVLWGGFGCVRTGLRACVCDSAHTHRALNRQVKCAADTVRHHVDMTFWCKRTSDFMKSGQAQWFLGQNNPLFQSRCLNKEHSRVSRGTNDPGRSLLTEFKRQTRFRLTESSSHEGRKLSVVATKFTLWAFLCPKKPRPGVGSYTPCDCHTQTSNLPHAPRIWMLFLLEIGSAHHSTFRPRPPPFPNLFAFSTKILVASYISEGRNEQPLPTPDSPPVFPPTGLFSTQVSCIPARLRAVLCPRSSAASDASVRNYAPRATRVGSAVWTDGGTSRGVRQQTYFGLRAPPGLVLRSPPSPECQITLGSHSTLSVGTRSLFSAIWWPQGRSQTRGPSERSLLHIYSKKDECEANCEDTAILTAISRFCESWFIKARQLMLISRCIR